MNRKIIASFGLLALWFTFGATVARGATITNGGSGTGNTLATFDSLPAGGAGGVDGGITVSFLPDAQAVTGSKSGEYATPFGDATQYLTSGRDASPNIGAAVTLKFSIPQTYVGLLWGSVDTYNVLDFYDAKNNLLFSVTGSDVPPPSVPNGNQNAAGTFYVNITSTVGSFTSVVAHGSQYAFEFDNVSYNTPEPASMTMLGLGIAGMAGYGWRRRKQAAIA